jgi:uncharacterized protein
LKKSWIAPLAAACVLSGMGGCEPRERDGWAVDAPVRFDTARAVIERSGEEEAVPIRVELASTGDQRAYGLMERPSLPPEQGMLFTYPEPQPPESGFWMYRTLIPLEIAFLDQAGEIVAILEMEPCEAANPRLCPIYSPGVPYVAALEVNRGFFGRWGIGVGDRVRVVEDGTTP